MAVKFEDFTIKVQDAIDDKINIALEESVGELEAQAKRNTRVDTGKTKNSWRHIVNPTLHEAAVGSSDENSIWEEFGTGEHALAGNGRKGGWAYKDQKGNWHRTKGKTPSRALQKAYDSKKNAIIKRIQSSLKGL